MTGRFYRYIRSVPSIQRQLRNTSWFSNISVLLASCAQCSHSQSYVVDETLRCAAYNEFLSCWVHQPGFSLRTFFSVCVCVPNVLGVACSPKDPPVLTGPRRTTRSGMNHRCSIKLLNCRMTYGHSTMPNGFYNAIGTFYNVIRTFYNGTFNMCWYHGNTKKAWSDVPICGKFLHCSSPFHPFCIPGLCENLELTDSIYMSLQSTFAQTNHLAGLISVWGIRIRR